MVGVMCSVGGGLGWAVSPESDRWGLSPSLWPPERGLLDRIWRFRPGLTNPRPPGLPSTASAGCVSRTPG